MGGFVSRVIQSVTRNDNVQQRAVERAPKGPTAIELNRQEDENRLRINRRGRKATILGGYEEDPELSKKVLLG